MTELPRFEMQSPRIPPRRRRLRTSFSLLQRDEPGRLEQMIETAQSSPIPSQRSAPLALPSRVKAREDSFLAMDPDAVLMLAAQDLMRVVQIGAEGRVEITHGPHVVQTWRPGPVDPTTVEEAIAAMWAHDFDSQRDDAQRHRMHFQDEDLELWMAVVLQSVADQTHPLTLDMLEALVRAVAFPVFRVKYLLDVPRPVTRAPAGLQPLLETPQHASYPSGHACAAYAMAEVLIHLACMNDVHAARARALAEDVAFNRQVAGLHTTLDSTAGRELGRMLGQFAVSAATDHPDAFPEWSMLYAGASREWVRP